MPPSMRHRVPSAKVALRVSSRTMPNVLILDATADPMVDVAIFRRGYTDLVNRFPDLSLDVITGMGVREYLPDATIRAFSRYTELPEFRRGGTAEAAAWNALRARRYDVLFAPREDDLIPAARLREWFGLAGQPMSSAVTFRDKYVMKRVAAECGVDVWPAFAVDSPTDLLRVINGIGFPCVVKPRLGSGGQGLRILRVPEDLAEAAVRSFEGLPVNRRANLIVEPFCGHDLYHIDGIWADGRILYCTPARYVGGSDHIPIEVSGHQPSGTIQIDPTSRIGRRLVSSTQQMLERMPTPRATTFHAEVWVDSAERVYLCEVASRIGGFLTWKVAYEAIGAEPDALWLAIECGIDPVGAGMLDASALRPVAGFRFPYRHGVVRRLPSGDLPKSIKEFNLDPALAVDAQLDVQQHWWQAPATAILVGNNYAELPSLVQAACDWLQEELVITA